MKQKGYTLAELMAVVAIIAWLTVGGLIVYAAIHFVMKFW